MIKAIKKGTEKGTIFSISKYYPRKIKTNKQKQERWQLTIRIYTAYWEEFQLSFSFFNFDDSSDIDIIIKQESKVIFYLNCNLKIKKLQVWLFFNSIYNLLYDFIYADFS